MKIAIALFALMIPVGVNAQTLSPGTSSSVGNPNYGAPFRTESPISCTPASVAQRERMTQQIASQLGKRSLTEQYGGALSRSSKERLRSKASAVVADRCGPAVAG